MTFEFAIRDDDTNYFTNPEELEEPYSSLPGDVPVSLAVVPYHGCTRTYAIPEEKWEGDERHPIGENEELVEYLRKEVDTGRFSIMLHGYDHTKFDGAPEFVGGTNLYDKLTEGRRYLEKLFSTNIDIFVPPNNSFSNRGLRAVKEANMKTVYYPTPRGRPLTREVLALTARDLVFKYRDKETNPIGFLKDAVRFWALKERDIHMPVYPDTYTVQGGEEFTCVSMNRNDPAEPVKKQIKVAAAHDGKFCLAIHYPAFRYEAFRERFFEIIEYTREEFDPRFRTVGELFDN